MKFIKVLLVMLLPIIGYSQSPCKEDGLCVVQFNASFNSANKVSWVGELSDCESIFIDIAADQKAAAKYKIVVVPTILIFNGSEEVGRFQANIMMQMEASKKEVQGKIDEIIMESF